MLTYRVPIYIFVIFKHHRIVLYSWFPSVKSLLTYRSFGQPVTPSLPISRSISFTTPQWLFGGLNWSRIRIRKSLCVRSLAPFLMSPLFGTMAARAIRKCLYWELEKGQKEELQQWLSMAILGQTGLGCLRLLCCWHIRPFRHIWATWLVHTLRIQCA